MRLVVSFGAATLLALGGGAAWAAPDTSSTVSSEVPVSGTVLNPCNGESVSWQGTAHFVVHQTVTSNGHDTLSGHVNFQGIQGQDSLGNAYRVANTANFELTTSGESAQSEFTTTAAILRSWSARNARCSQPDRHSRGCPAPGMPIGLRTPRISS